MNWSRAFDTTKWAAICGVVGTVLAGLLDAACAEQVASTSDWVMLVGLAVGGGAGALSAALRKRS